MKKNKSVTNAQKVFGKMFDNQPIITSRVEGTNFILYRRALKGQQKLIKRLLH